MTQKLIDIIAKVEDDDKVLTNAKGALNTATEAQAAQQAKLDAAVTVTEGAAVSVADAKVILVTDLKAFIAAAQESIDEITAVTIS